MSTTVSTSQRLIQTPSVANRAHAVRRHVACKAAGKEQSEKEAPVPVPAKFHSSYFPEVMSKLLWNASSMRDRGRASCNVCKTTGLVTCPHCGGSRVVSKASKSARAQAQAKLASFMLDTEQHRHKQDWIVTNRCTECHGAGAITCPACGGEGFRTAE
jgi:hypothetical protein